MKTCSCAFQSSGIRAAAALAVLVSALLALTPRHAMSNQNEYKIEVTPPSDFSVLEGETVSTTFLIHNMLTGANLYYEIAPVYAQTLPRRIYPSRGWLEPNGDQTITAVFYTAGAPTGDHILYYTIYAYWNGVACGLPRPFQFKVTVEPHLPAILRDGQPVSHQTFVLPFCQGITGAYYRDRLNLTAAPIEDTDQVREWDNQTDAYGAYEDIEDTTHPAPTWSYTPSGTLTGPTTLQISCEWTDDDDPSGTGDPAETDWVEVEVYASPVTTGYASPIMRWRDSSGAECANLDEGGSLWLRKEAKTGGQGGASQEPAWRVKDASAAELAWLKLTRYSGGLLNIAGEVFERYSWPNALPSYPYVIQNPGSGPLAAVDGSGNLLLTGNLMENAYGPALLDEPPKDGDPVNGGTSPATSSAAFLTYAAQYALGLLPGESDSLDKYKSELLDPYNYLAQSSTNWIGQALPSDEGESEADLVLQLAFVYHLLKDTWTTQERWDFFALLDEHAYNGLYSQDHRCCHNYTIRYVAAFTAASLILQYDTDPDHPDRTAHRKEMLNEGLKRLHQGFDCVYDENDPNLGLYWVRDVSRIFADTETLPPPAVGFLEGADYAYFTDKVFAGLVFLMKNYPLPDDDPNVETETVNRDHVLAKYRQFVEWIVDTQGPWGSWFPQNDSGVVDSWRTVRLLHTIYGDDPELQERLRTVYARMSDYPLSILRLQKDQNYAHKGLFLEDPWLDAAICDMPVYDGPPADGMRAFQHLYPKAGELFLGSTYDPEDPLYSTDRGIVGLFYNEGCWDKFETTETHWDTPWATSCRFQASEKKRDLDFMRKEELGYACLRDDEWSNPDEDDVSFSLNGLRPRGCHKRYDDTHFEIHAYGKGLLIGPGLMPYPRDWVPTMEPDATHNDYIYQRFGQGYPADLTMTDVYAYNRYNEANRPDAYNLTRVGATPDLARYPKAMVFDGDDQDTVRPMSDKIKDLGPTNGSAHLYKMESDGLSRYILWAHERYFIIFDRVNDSYVGEDPQYLELGLHGRGKLTEVNPTQWVNHAKFMWSYGERHDDFYRDPANPANDYVPEYNDRDYATRDPEVKLLLFVGNPWKVGSDVYTDYAMGPDGLDSGEGTTEADDALKAHNFFAHDVLKLKTFYSSAVDKRNQRGMVCLFWPQNDHLTNDSPADPTVEWEYDLDGEVITEIRVTVTYNVSYPGEQFSINDEWKFPFDETVDAYGDICQ